MLHDCERLLLITHGLSGDTAYNAVDFDEVRHLLQGCFENEPPDVGAGQDAIVDLLRFHLVDRVRGAAWHAWFDNGGSPPELIEQRVAVIEQQLNDFVQHGGEPEGPLTDAELEVLIENDEELVQGVLVARQPAILGGPQKTLKTLLGLDMALSLATGSCWLGNPDWRTMQPRRVAFYSGESGGRVLHRKRRIMEQVKRLGLEPDEQRQFDDALQQDNFRWEVRRSHLPDFSDRNSLDRWRRQIERVQSEVVFLDPTLLCLGAAGKDVANASISGQAVMAAVDACQSVGATLVLLHHSAGDRVRRQSGQGQEPLELWDLAYPGITQFMRQWIA
jgi:RecA-family ATPase